MAKLKLKDVSGLGEVAVAHVVTTTDGFNQVNGKGYFDPLHDRARAGDLVIVRAAGLEKTLECGFGFITSIVDGRVTVDFPDAGTGSKSVMRAVRAAEAAAENAGKHNLDIAKLRAAVDSAATWRERVDALEARLLALESQPDPAFKE